MDIVVDASRRRVYTSGAVDDPILVATIAPRERGRNWASIYYSTILPPYDVASLTQLRLSFNSKERGITEPALKKLLKARYYGVEHLDLGSNIYLRNIYQKNQSCYRRRSDFANVVMDVIEHNKPIGQVFVGNLLSRDVSYAIAIVGQDGNDHKIQIVPTPAILVAQTGLRGGTPKVLLSPSTRKPPGLQLVVGKGDIFEEGFGLERISYAEIDRNCRWSPLTREGYSRLTECMPSDESTVKKIVPTLAQFCYEHIYLPTKPAKLTPADKAIYLGMALGFLSGATDMGLKYIDSGILSFPSLFENLLRFAVLPFGVAMKKEYNSLLSSCLVPYIYKFCLDFQRMDTPSMVIDAAVLGFSMLLAEFLVPKTNLRIET